MREGEALGRDLQGTDYVSVIALQAHAGPRQPFCALEGGGNAVGAEQAAPVQQLRCGKDGLASAKRAAMPA